MSRNTSLTRTIKLGCKGGPYLTTVRLLFWVSLGFELFTENYFQRHIGTSVESPLDIWMSYFSQIQYQFQQRVHEKDKLFRESWIVEVYTLERSWYLFRNTKQK
jgi:hypothetical protein